MSETATSDRTALPGLGILLFPVGLMLAIDGIGQSGIVLESYPVWDPLNYLAVILIGGAAYLFLRWIFGEQIDEARASVSYSHADWALIAILMVGTPFITVATRNIDLGIDPLSLFFGLLAVACFARFYKMDFRYLALALPFFLVALGDSTNVLSFPENPQNPHILPAYAYWLTAGLTIILWSGVDLIRVLAKREEAQRSPVNPQTSG